MSKHTDMTPDTPEEETYEGILGDFQEQEEEAAQETAEAGPDAPAPAKKQGNSGARTVAAIAAAAVLVGCVSCMGITRMRAAMPRTAATSATCTVTNKMMTYCFHEMLDMYESSYGAENLLNYYGLDITKPLKEQSFPASEGTTWFDNVMESVKSNVTEQIILTEAGKADGFEMSDTDEAVMEKSIESVDFSGYGNHVNAKDIRDAVNLEAYSSAYYYNVYNGFEITDEELNSYADKLKVCGIMGINIIYDTETTAEENAIGLDKAGAQKIANELIACTSEEEFTEKCSDYLKTYYGYSDEDVTNALPNMRNDAFAYVEGNQLSEWAFGDAAVHDTLSIEAEGSYGIYMLTKEPSLDDSKTVNVRHILFTTAQHGGDADAEAAMAECHQLADKALEQWKKGEATEDSFGALALELSEDPGSVRAGGLYEHVYPGQMVTNFNDWCFDESRQPGDTATVETEYGVHVMYFVGDGGEKWRADADTAVRQEKYDAWYTEQQAKYPVTFNDDVINAIEG